MCYNYHHSGARMAVEQTFGMLVRKWLVLKRPYEGSLKRTTRSAGIFLTVGACCKLVRLTACAHSRRARTRPQHANPTAQHNWCVEHSAYCEDVLPEDLRGDRDPDLPVHGARQRTRPTDHVGRDRPLDPRAVHLSGANPDLADLEQDPTLRAAALAPAWYESTDVSPRDPLHALSSKPGAHQAALCGPRAAVTARMESVEQIRNPSAPVHW